MDKYIGEILRQIVKEKAGELEAEDLPEAELLNRYLKKEWDFVQQHYFGTGCSLSIMPPIRLR